MKNKGFSQIANNLIWDSDLDNHSKMLWINIRSLSEKYRTLRNRTLVQKLGISLNTLQSCKKQLIKKGYLIIHRKTSANYYDLRLPKIDVTRVATGKQVITQKLGNIVKSNNRLYNNIKYKKAKGFKKFNE
jgi:DNA-binding transcriptional MocR family regulator|tara:strand:- start:65 stop:457 length:393 start_codon:yes stop_codon:yes gene_type:complete